MNKVTAVHHPSGTITAFPDKLPGLVVQGRSKEEISRKLDIAIDAYVRRVNAMKNNFEIETKELA